LTATAKDTADTQARIRTIIEDPALHEEARKVAAHLERMARPLGELPRKGHPRMYAAMQKLMVICKAPDFGESNSAVAKNLTEAWLKVYFEALEDLPEGALLSGVDAFIKSPDVRYGFPQPGTLRTYCEPFAIQMRMAAYRAKKASETKRGPKPKERTPEEREEIKRMATECLSGLKMKTLAPPPRRRGTPGQVAEAWRRIDDDLKARKAARSDDY
jgi:hypothetical protein